MNIYFASIFVQSIVIITAFEFVAAMRLYFRQGAAKRPNYAMSIVSLSVVGYHGYCLFRNMSMSWIPLSGSFVLLITSNLLFWSAIISHGSNRPAVVFGESLPNHLVTVGPYRFIRHPFYLAYILGFLGSSIASGFLLQYVTTILIFLLYNLAAQKEENSLLSSSFSEIYSHYLKKTWRWCPLVW